MLLGYPIVKLLRRTMPDYLTANTIQNTFQDTEIEISRPLGVRIARYISNILAPITISGPLVVVVALYHAVNLLSALVYACVTLFFLSFGPLVYILLGVRLGKFSDIDLSHRTERTGPFLFSIASITLGLAILMYIHGPKNLETVLICTGVSAVILMVTTLRWKISVHASSLAGAATILTALYGVIVLPTFLLLVIVSWSRVALHRHTVAQVVVGSLVGIALTTIIIILRGA